MTTTFISVIIIVLVLWGLFVLSYDIAYAPQYNMARPQMEFMEADRQTEELESQPVEIMLAFGGDIMLSRTVGQKMVKYDDFTWPFQQIAKIFKTADIAMINLESPFTTDGSYFVPTGSFSFDADPRSIEGLKLAGIDIVALANNHFGNQGREGMKATFEVLDGSEMYYVGAGNNEIEARSGQTVEVSGIKFGFLAYAYPTELYVAGVNNPGIANMDPIKASEDIRKLKAQVDIVIVNMHSGTEYTNTPNQKQRNFAHVAVEAGADLVIGHHPHWVQVTEIYQGKPILYSLGNLVFDQMWSRETQQGAIAKVYFKDKVLEKIEIIPVRIADYGQPQVVTSEAEIKEILGRMDLATSTIWLNQ